MKTTVTLLILFTLFSVNTFAEYESYTQFSLPDGAKARLGKGSINEIQYSPDGTQLAVAGSIGIWLYDAQTGQELDLLTGHTSVVTSVSFSPDGTTIASGSNDSTVRLWDTATGAHLRTLEGHTGRVYSVSFSPDGATIASGVSGFWDNTVRLWDAATGEHLRTLEGHTDWVYSVAFSPDGTTIASGSSDDTVRLWDAATGEHLRTLEGHTDDVLSVSFSPDGTTIASGSWDDTVRLWDAATGEHLRTLEGHTWDVSSVSFSPDGATIASGSSLGTILLWALSPSNGSNGEVAVEPLAKRFTTLGNIKRTALLQNYPNPFNPETWIPYQLAEDAMVTLTIYNSSGLAVRTLELGNQISGSYESRDTAAYWDGRNEDGEFVTSGVYFYQLRAGDYTATRRMLIVK